MAVKQKEREAGGSSGEPASIELGGLFAEVYAVQYKQKEYSVFFKVLMRGHPEPLCKVELSLRNEKPLAVYVGCLRLGELASECARGGGCRLSLEEARAALGLAVWAANVLAELAGAPLEVEEVELVEAYDIGTGGPSVLPCLQVSVNGKSYSICRWAYLRRDPGGGWRVKGGLRLVPIGEAHARMVGALVELREMVSEYTWYRESESARYMRVRKRQGEFLELEEIVLHRPDGTEEVLLKPRLYKLYYLGEGFTMLECVFFDKCTKSNDSELADALRKELEEVVGVVVQECKRYTEELDPRYAALAYIAAEAVRRAGLAPA